MQLCKNSFSCAKPILSLGFEIMRRLEFLQKSKQIEQDQFEVITTFRPL